MSGFWQHSLSEVGDGVLDPIGGHTGGGGQGADLRLQACVSELCCMELSRLGPVQIITKGSLRS